MPQTNFALPIKLDGSNEVNAESIAKYYAHVEKDHRGGYYPLGANTIWHGGIHIRASRGTEVFSMLSGKIIAAKLPENEGVAIRRYGHIGFILLEHVFKSQKLYSLYCHLDNTPLSENDPKIAQVAWLATGGIAANLGRLKTGDLVKFDIPVKAGDLLWFSGLHGSPSSRAELLHWEVFSEARLFDEVPLATPPQTLRPWRVVADTDGNFNVDSPKIRGMLPAAISEDGNLTLDEIVAFYKGNPQGKAATLRDTACRFVSEWGIPDLDQACKELKNRWYFEASPKDNIAPFQWWQQAIEAQVALPSSPHVWHYHPVRILEEVKWIEDTAPYGGFVLALNDSDATKQWGGEVRTVDGAFVAELQRDLVALGYWVSDGNTTNGMVVNGVYSIRTKGAVCTFQRELTLPETGVVDRVTGNKIKECRSNSEWVRPSHIAGAYGEFVQLKPSNNLRRYLENIDASGVVTDNWGLATTMDLLQSAGRSWIEDGKSPFHVGDISLYNGGTMRPHTSHQIGQQVDIWHPLCCDIRKPSYNKTQALELAQQFAQSGFTQILFNCKYVTENCGPAVAKPGHEHHFHLEAVSSGSTSDASHECKFCKKSVYDACDYAQKATRTDTELTP